MKWFWCELDTLYSLLENWLRDHTSWALSGIGVKIKSLPKNFWSSVLNFTTSRYSLLFSYSEIYIAHVIYYEWSRSVIIPLRTSIFPTLQSLTLYKEGQATHLRRIDPSLISHNLKLPLFCCHISKDLHIFLHLSYKIPLHK